MRRVLSQTVLLLLVFSLTAFSGGKFNVVTEIEEAQGFASLFEGTFQGLNRHFVNYRQNDSGNVVPRSGRSTRPCRPPTPRPRAAAISAR